MLSGIYNSVRACQVNIEIMRTFRLRHLISDNDDFKREVEEPRKQSDTETWMLQAGYNFAKTGYAIQNFDDEKPAIPGGQKRAG